MAPTALGLAGVPVPDWMEGYDWSHVRTGKEPTHSEPDSTYIQAIEHREKAPLPSLGNQRRLEICRYRVRSMDDV